MPKLKLFWAILALAVTAVATLSILPAGAAGATEQIQINQFSYSPTPLTVSPGELVRVINHDAQRQDSVPHTVTAYSGAFDTGVIWDTPVRFRAPTARGVYQYFCEIHPFMRGTLRVAARG